MDPSKSKNHTKETKKKKKKKKKKKGPGFTESVYNQNCNKQGCECPLAPTKADLSFQNHSAWAEYLEGPENILTL